MISLKNYKLNPDQDTLTWCRRILLKEGYTVNDQIKADLALHGIMNYQPHTPEF